MLVMIAYGTDGLLELVMFLFAWQSLPSLFLSSGDTPTTTFHQGSFSVDCTGVDVG